jgi:hypothetical protein
MLIVTHHNMQETCPAQQAHLPPGYLDPTEQTWHNVVVIHPLIDLRGEHLDAWICAAHPSDALGGCNDGEE